MYGWAIKKRCKEAVDLLVKSRKYIPSKLQEKGVDFTQPYRVLEVCDPFEAQKVLTGNSLVGYFLPCKIVVYQDLDQHTTKIGLTRPTVLMEILNDETLKEIAQQIEETLMEAIQEAR